MHDCIYKVCNSRWGTQKEQKQIGLSNIMWRSDQKETNESSIRKQK